jgi:hypothetical protein
VETQFCHIKEFSLVKEYCIFCGQKLRLQLSNYMGHAGGVQSLTIPCVRDMFEVSINYSGKQINVEADGFLLLQTNKLFFKIRDEDIFVCQDPHKTSVENFEKLSLHLSLKCENLNCDHNYFICSSLLKCSNKHYEKMDIVRPVFEIMPFNLFMESFTMGDVWVQNLWDKSLTYLYSIEKYEDNPIEIPLIDWSKMNSDKIRNKIKTLVILS